MFGLWPLLLAFSKLTFEWRKILLSIMAYLVLQCISLAGPPGLLFLFPPVLSPSALSLHLAGRG